MSPIWIPWFAFWSIVVFIIMRISHSSARLDRARDLTHHFDGWKTCNVKMFIENVSVWEDEGVVNSHELDMKIAAQIVVERRQSKIKAIIAPEKSE